MMPQHLLAIVGIMIVFDVMISEHLPDSSANRIMFTNQIDVDYVIINISLIYCCVLFQVFSTSDNYC